MDILLILKLVFILGVINGAPILAARLLAQRANCPVDFAKRAWDGRPWLGRSKTWRGIAAAYLLAMPVAWWFGFDTLNAASLIGFSMLGDLFSSFCKRRLAIPASGQALGLDQIPESLLPMLFLWQQQQAALPDVVSVVLLFILLELWLSRLLFHWHIRKRPY